MGSHCQFIFKFKAKWPYLCIKWHPPPIRLLTKSWFHNQTYFVELRGFYGAFAPSEACEQGTLIPPDTWSHPVWDMFFIDIFYWILFCMNCIIVQVRHGRSGSSQHHLKCVAFISRIAFGYKNEHKQHYKIQIDLIHVINFSQYKVLTQKGHGSVKNKI